MLLTEKDDSTIVQAGVGDTVEVALSENPSTGYRWEVTGFGSPLVSVEHNGFSAARGAIGAAGTRSLVFRARSPGAARIELSLRRHWEPASAAIKRWAITIDVHDG